MNEADDVAALRRAMTLGLQPNDIEHVVPIIVPRELVSLANWPGPTLRLRSPLLGLTWTLIRPEQTMTYVNHQRVRAWEEEGLTDWRERAISNLRQLEEGRLWTHEKRDDAGRLLCAAMMHEDGLGSSRLLLRDELLHHAGGEYRIGMPDRSCGMLFPLAAGTGNMRDAARIVREMFEGATTPMLGDLLDPASLAFEVW
jgi:hypothetical protein